MRILLSFGRGYFGLESPPGLGSGHQSWSTSPIIDDAFAIRIKPTGIQIAECPLLSIQCFIPLQIRSHTPNNGTRVWWGEKNKTRFMILTERIFESQFPANSQANRSLTLFATCLVLRAPNRVTNRDSFIQGAGRSLHSMLERAKHFLKLSWWGSPVAYVVTLVPIWFALWNISTQAGLPLNADAARFPPPFKTWWFIHALLALTATSHIVLGLEFVLRRRAHVSAKNVLYQAKMDALNHIATSLRAIRHEMEQDVAKHSSDALSKFGPRVTSEFLLLSEKMFGLKEMASGTVGCEKDETCLRIIEKIQGLQGVGVDLGSCLIGTSDPQKFKDAIAKIDSVLNLIEVIGAECSKQIIK